MCVMKNMHSIPDLRHDFNDPVHEFLIKLGVVTHGFMILRKARFWFLAVHLIYWKMPKVKFYTMLDI